MSQDAERKRPDPYADESTIVRRKRGVTIGAYQGLTIAALACLVGALFFLGVNTMAQKLVSLVALAVAAVFVFTMARRKSRSVESDRTQMLVAVWLVGTAMCWIAMAVVLFLPANLLWERGPIYATAIGATGVLMTAIGALTLSSIYGRDWASRKGRAS
jgi:Kef-type K+ transport system membrane component KefB